MHTHSSILRALAPCAAALLLGLPSAASAQSQLQLSGFLDVGIYHGFDRATHVGTIQRSNVALSGSEDLGGGLKAGFRFSSRFEMGTGAIEGDGAKPFWHDESTVGLAGSWGSLRMGRALTALWAYDWEFDPWANFNRIASPAWYYWHALAPTDRVSNNGSAEYGRMNNGFFYDSPAFSGVTVHLSATPDRTMAPGSQGRGYSAAMRYHAGPIAAMLAHERNGSGDRVTFLGGKYAAGAFAAMVALDYSHTGGGAASARALTLGATYAVGVTTLKAGYGRQRTGGVTHQFASLGADYALSKRSTAYVSLGHQKPSGARSATAFGVGLSHAF